MVSFEVVPVDKPAIMNVIIGQAHLLAEWGLRDKWHGSL